MSEYESGPSHGRVWLVAEIGAAGLGLAAAGATAYMAYRKRRAEAQRALNPAHASMYEQRLAAIEDRQTEHHLPHGRELLAAVAVRVYYASFASVEQAVTKQQLHQELDRASNDHLYVYDYQLQKALGHLERHELIGRRPQAEHSCVHGYYALPALNWGMEYAEAVPPILVAAQADFLAEHL